MKKFLGAALLALLLSACQNSPSPWYQAYGTTSFPVAKDGMAALYIVREAAPPDAPSIPISMSRNPVGGLTGSTWMRLDLPPNLYDLRAFGDGESTELIITLIPGETRFLLAEPKGTNDAQLTWLSQEDGRRLVRQGTQVGTYINF
jgi:hypothetical protein